MLQSLELVEYFLHRLVEHVDPRLAIVIGQREWCAHEGPFVGQ